MRVRAQARVRMNTLARICAQFQVREARLSFWVVSEHLVSQLEIS